MYERRSTTQLVIAISTILSIMVGSISLITFVQSSEKRITTMEVRLESLRDSIEQLRTQLFVYNKKT